MRISRIAVAATSVAAVLTIGGGVAAYASIPDSGGVIHGCYNHDGLLSVIDTSQTATCPHGYSALTWDQTGPAGPQGQPGPQGPIGPQGPAGQAGSAGPSTAGPAGLDIIKVSAGGTGNVFADCPPDHPYLTGGGGLTLFGGPLSASFGVDGTAGAGSGAWQVSAVNAGDLVDAVAYCAK